MNIVSASALAGLAALATIWALTPDGPTPVAAPTGSLPVSGAFLEGRSVLLAVDGTCETRTDVGGSLLSSNGTDVEVMTDAELDVAGTPEPEPPVEAAVEAAMNAPIAGTCGGQPVGGETDAGVAMAEGATDEPSTDQAVGDEPDVAMLEPEPRPTPAPVAPSKPKPQRAEPPKEPLTAWWPTARTDALNVLFVGEASFGSAISVLTDGRFDNTESANASIQVRHANGKTVNRRWQLATNRQMLLLPVQPGVYTVSIQPELTDAQGRRAGSASRGRVYVR